MTRSSGQTPSSPTPDSILIGAYMKFWAFAANPQTYRIEDAVRKMEFDYWTTRGSKVRKGDRAIIWKTLGKSKLRGVLCLADVVGDPAEHDDSANPYWLDEDDAQHPGPSVRVRYVHLPNTPMWIDGEQPQYLHDLSVSRAQGGTVFKVTPEQWAAVLEAAGGWPLSPLVLVENERTAEGRYDHWQDATGERYHFPNQYKNRMVAGRRFVYYRGKRRADGGTGSPEYFGHGVLGATHLDPETDTSEPKARWRWYCEIDEYGPFSEPVPFKIEGKYIEDIPPNFWSVAVRELPEGAYRKILELGGGQLTEAIESAVRKSLDLPPIDELTIRESTNQNALVAANPRPVDRTASGSVGRRRSEYSKAIGDQGERIVLRYLRETLPPKVAKTVRWVANEGKTPGWDIEYTEDGQKIGVEVKATRGSAFPSIEVTAKEWEAARDLRGRYRLALVVNACSRNPSIEFVDDPWGEARSGRLITSPLAWKIQRASPGEPA